jgi:peptidyl-prolyl cis-trans isomerase D
MPTLDSVRQQVTAEWMARENVRLLSAKSDALMARLRAGEDIAAVARSVGATVTTRTGVKQDAETVEQLGEAVIGGLFNVAQGQPFAEARPEGGMVIGRTDRIAAPTAALIADEAQQWRARIGGAMGEPLFAAAVTSAAERMKATYDEDLARQALGVEAAPAAPGAPARPAGQ